MGWPAPGQRDIARIIIGDGIKLNFGTVLRLSPLDDANPILASDHDGRRLRLRGGGLRGGSCDIYRLRGVWLHWRSGRRCSLGHLSLAGGGGSRCRCGWGRCGRRCIRCDVVGLARKRRRRFNGCLGRLHDGCITSREFSRRNLCLGDSRVSGQIAYDLRNSTGKGRNQHAIGTGDHHTICANRLKAQVARPIRGRNYNQSDEIPGNIGCHSLKQLTIEAQNHSGLRSGTASDHGVAFGVDAYHIEHWRHRRRGGFVRHWICDGCTLGGRGRGHLLTRRDRGRFDHRRRSFNQRRNLCHRWHRL